MKRLLFITALSFCVSQSFAQLAVYGDGKVQLSGTLPYYPYHNDVAQFEGNVFVIGTVYYDIPTGITSKSGGSRLSEAITPTISACRQLYALASDTVSTNRMSGLSFEQLQKEFPNLTRVDNDGHKSVDFIGLIPVLIRAINELQDEVDSLKGQLEKRRKE